MPRPLILALLLAAPAKTSRSLIMKLAITLILAALSLAAQSVPPGGSSIPRCIGARTANCVPWANSTGNVGIGTAGPGADLDIAGSTAVSSNVLKIYNTTGSYGWLFQNQGNPTLAIGLYGYDSTGTRKVQLGVAGASYFNGGNVGIGTTSPTGQLTISTANGNSNNILTTHYWNSGTQYTGFYVDNQGIPIVRTASYFGVDSESFRLGGTALQFNSTYNMTWSNGSYSWNTADINLSRGAAGKLYVGNGTAGDYTGTLIAGNVGIGTTSPGQKLEINGNAKVVELHVSTSTEGTCDASNRGRVVFVAGGAGVADTWRICRKDATDTYAFAALY